MIHQQWAAADKDQNRVLDLNGENEQVFRHRMNEAKRRKKKTFWFQGEEISVSYAQYLLIALDRATTDA